MRCSRDWHWRLFDTRYTMGWLGLGDGFFWLHSVCFLGISIKFWVLYHNLGSREPHREKRTTVGE
jgi:hypothetical protein